MKSPRVWRSWSPICPSGSTGHNDAYAGKRLKVCAQVEPSSELRLPSRRRVTPYAAKPTLAATHCADPRNVLALITRRRTAASRPLPLPPAAPLAPPALPTLSASGAYALTTITGTPARRPVACREVRKERIPVAIRHMQIEQHHVAASRVEPRERIVGIGDGVRVEIHVRDHFAERLANQPVVVDDQHARARAARLGLRRDAREARWPRPV